MAASILIADDDAVQRRLVENMVQKCGYEAVVVDSGDAAIAMLTAPDAPNTFDNHLRKRAIGRVLQVRDRIIRPDLESPIHQHIASIDAALHANNR